MLGLRSRTFHRQHRRLSPPTYGEGIRRNAKQGNYPSRLNEPGKGPPRPWLTRISQPPQWRDPHRHPPRRGGEVIPRLTAEGEPQEVGAADALQAGAASLRGPTHQPRMAAKTAHHGVRQRLHEGGQLQHGDHTKLDRLRHSSMPPRPPKTRGRRSRRPPQPRLRRRSPRS